MTARRLSHFLRWKIAVAGLLGLVFSGWAVWYFLARPEIRAQRHMAQARSFRSAGKIADAEQAAASALSLDSGMVQAAFLAAECAESQGEFSRASDYLGRIASSDSRVQVRASLAFAQLNHHRLHRLSDAESAYRTVLELAPDNVEGNEGLAKLLALCGRKREIVPLVLRLVKLGVETDLLVLIAREEGVVNDLQALEQARKADPGDPNPLLGLAWHKAEAEQTAEAIELLRTAVRLRRDFAAAHVALGRQLLAAGRLVELEEWTEQLPAGAADFAETWLIRAQLAEDDGQTPAAIRCYGEAVLRMPESKAANVRLVRLLSEVGAAKAAAGFSENLRRLEELKRVQDRVFLSRDSTKGVAPLLELSKSYASVGRLWEACGWCRFAVGRGENHREALRLLDHLQNEVEGLPLRLVADAFNPAMSVDLSNYPLPPPQHVARHSPKRPSVATSSALTFRDDSDLTGMKFRYFNGAEGAPTHRMFEFTGGGVAVLDFDGDGFSDVFWTQGRRWPPESSDSTHRDQLFRNLAGARFEAVTTVAGIDESGFGQGAAIGDVNADGFADLYVANIGKNCLWLNNGDGTFIDVTNQAGLGGREWTTSCVLADLSGDGLPDIYDVNYVTAPDVFDRVCRHDDGSPKLCMPYDFFGQTDRFWLNDGEGRFTDATATALSVEPSGMGLGAAAWEADGSGRLSLLVANDTTPKFFFAPESSDLSAPFLRERGIEAGLAFNGEGKATGSMGIALGDVDGDGRMDAFITNFLAEPSTLYVNPSGFSYEDRTREFGLRMPLLDTLGFGTQFLDADLDGTLELFVANGHVDDLSKLGRPYRMPPQLFRWNGRRFVLVNSQNIGPYFCEKWLGRPAARIDWNRDGRDDLLVGHLGDDSVLLTNTTSEGGRFLSLKLFGVQSNRDAVGTTLRARIGGRTLTRQLTAGDGYQCSNERRVIIGAGNTERLDELEIRWPSGIVQRFEYVAVSQEVWVTEGRSALTVILGTPNVR